MIGYLAVMATGYVLGTKAGRQRYEQIINTYRAVTSNPATRSMIDAGRRKIAEKMQESKRRIPHFSYVEEIDVTALEELRAHLNAKKRKDQPKLNVLPFIARAMVVDCAVCLRGLVATRSGE